MKYYNIMRYALIFCWSKSYLSDDRLMKNDIVHNMSSVAHDHQFENHY